jgi:hypothetical protein
VYINHTWREGNRSADWLANFSLSLTSFNLHVLENPSRDLQRLYFYDIFGACMPHNIRLTVNSVILSLFGGFAPPFVPKKNSWYIYIYKSLKENNTKHLLPIF